MMEEFHDSAELCKQSKDLIVRLRKYFARECQNGGPLIPVNLILERVSEALCVDVTLVEQINVDYENMKAKSNAEKAHKEKQDRDVQNIILQVNQFYKEKPTASRTELIKHLKDAKLFSGAYSALHELLIKSSYKIIKKEAKKILMSNTPIIIDTKSMSDEQSTTHTSEKIDYLISTSVDVEPVDEKDLENEPGNNSNTMDATSSSDVPMPSTSKSADINFSNIPGSNKKKNRPEDDRLIKNNTFIDLSEANTRSTIFLPTQQDFAIPDDKRNVDFSRLESKEVEFPMSAEFIQKEKQYKDNLQAIVRHINDFYCSNRTASQDELLTSLRKANLYDGSYSTLFMMILQKSSYKQVITEKINQKDFVKKKITRCEMDHSEYESDRNDHPVEVPQSTTVKKNINKGLGKTSAYDDSVINHAIEVPPSTAIWQSSDKGKINVRSNHESKKCPIKPRIIRKHIPLRDRKLYTDGICTNKGQKQENRQTLKLMAKKTSMKLSEIIAARKTDFYHMNEKRAAHAAAETVSPLRCVRIVRLDNKVEKNNKKSYEDTDEGILKPLKPVKVYRYSNKKKLVVKKEPYEIVEQNCIGVNEFINLASEINTNTDIKEEFNTFDYCFETDEDVTMGASYFNL